MPKTITKIIIIVLLAYAAGITVYQIKTITQSGALKARLNELNAINAKARTELDRLNSERVKLEQETGRLKGDSLVYLKQQSILQDELDELKQKVSVYKTKIDTIKTDLDDAEQKALKFKQEQQKLGHEKEAEIKSKQEKIAAFESETAQLKLALDKKQALFHYNFGVIYTENGDYNQAVNEYEKALKLNPNFSNVYYNLGIIYSDYFNDKETAVSYYQEYLKLEPQASDAEEVKSWIDALK